MDRGNKENSFLNDALLLFYLTRAIYYIKKWKCPLSVELPFYLYSQSQIEYFTFPFAFVFYLLQVYILVFIPFSSIILVIFHFLWLCSSKLPPRLHTHTHNVRPKEWKSTKHSSDEPFETKKKVKKNQFSIHC